MKPVWINYIVTTKTELDVQDDTEDLKDEYMQTALYYHINKLLNAANLEILDIEVLEA